MCYDTSIKREMINCAESFSKIGGRGLKVTQEIKEEKDKRFFIAEKWNKWADERPAVARWVREGGVYL